MGNQLNSGSLDTLKVGQTLLVNARKVKNNKLHLEFAEILSANDKPVSALSLLNKSDERFTSNARRSWMTAEPVDASNVFGVSFGNDAAWEMTPKGEVLELNILNPEHQNTRFRLIVQETTEPTEWQADNLERAAKRKGKEGDFITHEGEYIFSNTDVIVTNEDTTSLHSFLQPDSKTIASNVTAKAEEEFDTSMMM